MYRLLVGFGACCALLFAACGDDTYPVDLDDEAYDLEAMSLLEEDLPAGYLQAFEGFFDNEEFSLLFEGDDADQRKRQLDALGRIKGFVRFFSWETPEEHFGRPVTFTVQSTLYVDTAAAIESIRTTCGLLVDERRPIEDFRVPTIGDEGSGFRQFLPYGVSGLAVDTNVCFRTGRIIHAVSQSGLEGTDDVALSVRLAERMLRRVRTAFAAADTSAEPGS